MRGAHSRQFFVLQEHVLLYFKSEKDSTAKGEILLENAFARPADGFVRLRNVYMHACVCVFYCCYCMCCRC